VRGLVDPSAILQDIAEHAEGPRLCERKGFAGEPDAPARVLLRSLVLAAFSFCGREVQKAKVPIEETPVVLYQGEPFSHQPASFRVVASLGHDVAQVVEARARHLPARERPLKRDGLSNQSLGLGPPEPVPAAPEKQERLRGFPRFAGTTVQRGGSVGCFEALFDPALPQRCDRPDEQCLARQEGLCCLIQQRQRLGRHLERLGIPPQAHRRVRFEAERARQHA
jgi:hypothetical protein